MQTLIYFLPAQKQIAVLNSRQIFTNKVFVDLRQLCLQAVQVGNITFDFHPSKQLCGFQPVQPRDQGVPRVNGDRA